MGFVQKKKIYESYLLPVSDVHSLYVEECGNPNGEPIIFLHGGPGAGCGKKARRFFDPEYYHIILFDQRGCGRSIPFLDILSDNLHKYYNPLQLDLNLK